jgi:hypothetical protein
MDSAAFLEGYGTNACLRIKTPNGESRDLGVNLEVIAETCPLFASEFEETGPLGELKKTVGASSQSVIVCFLRYIYRGRYVLDETDPEPCHLLLHAELYHIAIMYDLPLLQVEAYQNLGMDLELACCLPHPPADLCETISFVYKHLASQESLIQNILHYIVGCFTYHHLDQNEAFKQLFSENHQFSKDVSRLNMERGFEDAGMLLPSALNGAG